MEYTDEQLKEMLQILPLGIYNLNDILEIYSQEDEI